MTQQTGLSVRLLLLTVLATNSVKAEAIPLPIVSKQALALQAASRVEVKEQKSSTAYELKPIEVSAVVKDPWEKTLIGFYNQNVQQIQQLPSRARVHEISAKDSAQLRLLKQRWNGAIELYRLTSLRLQAGLLTNGNVAANDSFEKIQMGAIQIALAEADLAETKANKIAAYDTCLSIASAWQRDAQAQEVAGLGTRFDTLSATYWRQYCESRKMQEQG